VAVIASDIADARPEPPRPALPEIRNWSFRMDLENIGWLTLDVQGSGVNTLGTETILELEKLVSRFEDMAVADELVGVVLMSGKSSGFIAGADIAQFDNLSDGTELAEALTRTHALFDRIEKLPVPFVCGIHGYCLGGGLELALAAHYRIAVNDEKTRIGFPEVKLGIFPGFGGTGRSVRQAGPVAAMQSMLTGKYHRAGAARGMGFVDKLVRHPDQLRWEARKAVLAGKRSQPAGWTKQLPARGPLRSYTANQMRAQTAKKVRQEHYPAPFSLIDLFEAKGNDPVAMRRAEIERFVPLMASEQARNLRRVFFLSEGLKKQGVSGNAKPRFSRVHVIGAGVMGGDIAAWCAYRGMAVTLQDLDMERIQPALDRAKSLFRKRLKKPSAVSAAMGRIEADVEGDGVARADVVIEAVVENLEIKQKIFAEVEAAASPNAILATNTSSIELERIAAGLKDPARLIGLHFFNPVAQLPLVEVIRSDKNDDRAVELGSSFALAISKSPVIVKSKPGFLVNRVLMPYMLAAVERVEGGEKPELLDAACEAFGMPMGPIELMDTVGLDVARNVATELGHGVPDNSRFAKLVKDGHLGRKTGRGFYRWQKGKAVKHGKVERERLAEFGAVLVKPLVDACETCVAEGVVKDSDTADIGVILGTGFAPFLGGPLKAREDGKV